MAKTKKFNQIRGVAFTLPANKDGAKNMESQGVNHYRRMKREYARGGNSAVNTYANREAPHLYPANQGGAQA